MREEKRFFECFFVTRNMHYILTAYLIVFMINCTKELTNAVILPSVKNITRNSHFMIYNRIPKCGSTTALTIMRRLAWKNGFEWVGKYEISEIIERNVKETLKKLRL